nr:hypothetical protein CFP56_61797 [Quercus suber]
MESPVYVDIKPPPYPEEIAGKLYPANYTSPIWNAREHIRQYVNVLTAHSYEHKLRLKEFSKSLEGRAFTWYTSLAPGFRDLSLLCYDLVEKERLVDVCIAGMLYEYRPYLENFQISSFTKRVEATRRTSMFVRKPLKGSTSQVVSALRQPWRRENKKVEVAMTKEPKKVAKGKKRDRGGIPPPFTVSIKELYSILKAWVKDGVVTLPECKHEPIEEEKRNPLYCRVAKGDLVIKTGKRADPRMRRPDVAMTFFIGHEDPMEEKAENMASSSSAPLSLVNEEMIARIQQEDKIHSFLEGIGLRLMARREAA